MLLCVYSVINVFHTALYLIEGRTDLPQESIGSLLEDIRTRIYKKKSIATYDSPRGGGGVWTPCTHLWILLLSLRLSFVIIMIEPRHEISNNVICATSKASDQPAHTRSLVRAFASRWNIPLLLSYRPNNSLKGGCTVRLGLYLSECHIVGNHISQFNYLQHSAAKFASDQLTSRVESTSVDSIHRTAYHSLNTNHVPYTEIIIQRRIRLAFLILMDFLNHIDIISMGKSIVHFKGRKSNFSNNMYFPLKTGILYPTEEKLLPVKMISDVT